jgi:fibronectin type 3 domain-containing protein
MNIRKLGFSSLLFGLLALVLTGCPEVVKAVTNPPPTPVNFTANAASATTINLSWSSSQGATGYKLERKTGAAAFAQIATPNGTTYSDTGLTGSTAYTYRLIANNLNGDSAGAESTATTSATAPVAPTEFTASATSSTEIALTWKASVGATGYKLERKTGTAAFAQIGTPTGISYKDTELTGNTAYTYRLVASNSGGDSPAVESSATTKTVTTSSPPTTPTDFAANVTSSTTISLSWTASVNATGYKLERKTGSAAFAQIATPSGVTYADTGLTANTTYSYRLVANNTVGDSPAVEVTATTQAVVVVSPPAEPTGFAASASSTEIFLTWNASKGATSYKLERKTDKEPFVSLPASKKLTAYTDSGLKENTAYTYRLVASNLDGDSTPVEITATTQVVVGNPPAAPTSFIATANSSSTISLSWNAATGATGYKLERKTGTAAFAQIATPTSTTYNDTGLNASTAYSYRLVANNANGDSAAVESSATTQAVVVGNPPGTPTGFIATANSSSTISLSWNSVSGATDYKLERKTGAAAYALLTTQSSTSYNDTGLSASTAYTYRLVASNSGGDSSPTEKSATTLVGTNPNAAEINAYFYGLPSWSSRNPLKDEDRTNGTTSRDTSAVLPDPTTESGQRRYDCTTTPYTLSKTPDKIVTFSPDAGKLWLGALLQGNGYVGGLGSLSELPIRDRAPMRMYIDLIGPGVTETVNSPDGASVQTAISNLIGRAKAAGTQAGSSISYDKREMSSSEEFALKFGLSVKYMTVDVKTKLDVARKANEKTVTAYFIQKAFTVAMVSPQTPAEFFSDAFTKARLDEQVNLTTIGPNNLPVYVSNIAYGRVLMFSITSTASTQDIQAALDASYNAATVGVNANLDVKSQDILNKATIKVVSIGGDDNALISLIRTGDLYQYFQKSADLSTYKPLSYQVDNPGDRSPARFTETTNYNLRECAPLPNNRVKVGEVANLSLTRILVPLKTVKNGNTIDNCQQIRFDGGPFADAWGELNVDSISWWSNPRTANIKISTGGSSTIATPALQPGTLPAGLYPVTPLQPGERVFLDGSGDGFQIDGFLKDEQGLDGDPVNEFKQKTVAYPFTYGKQTIGGNSDNCRMDVEYNLEKVRDVFRVSP